MFSPTPVGTVTKEVNSLHKGLTMLIACQQMAYLF